jgi:hypothetical protein
MLLDRARFGRVATERLDAADGGEDAGSVVMQGTPAAAEAVRMNDPSVRGRARTAC